MSQPKQEIEEFYKSYERSAADIITYIADKKEAEIMLNKLKDIAKRNYEENMRLNAIENLNKYFLEDQNIDDVTNNSIEKIVKEYKTAVSSIEVDVTSNERLAAFNQQMDALITDLNKDENAEEDNSAEELQLITDSINIIDPISKKRIVNPVKNVICGHTYDRDSITAVLQANKKTRCPFVGCTSDEYISLSNLQMDIAMQAYLRKHPA